MTDAKTTQKKTTARAPATRRATAAKSKQVAAPVQEHQAVNQMIEVIERVAMNPEVDVEKMEKLLDMQERILDRQAQQEFDIAMANMQPELPVVAKKGIIYNKDGTTVRSKYAKFEDINKEVKPILSQYGFSMTFNVNQSGNEISVVGNLAHKAGHRESTSITLGPDVSGNKNAVQAVASSVSYGKRYTMSALLNLIFEDEDDDGENAVACVTQDQAEKLAALFDKSAKNIQRWMIDKYGSVDNVPKADFAWLMTELNAKLRKTPGKSSRAESIVDAHADGEPSDNG
jgi:hypothetical protein